MKLTLQTECLNSCIFIIDGLTDEDLQTAKRLYDDMEFHKGLAPSPVIGYRKVSTREGLFGVFAEVTESCRNGHFPILHFEVHGNQEQGIFLGNAQENVSWSDLVQTFRQINIICGNNLGVIMAGCYGIYAITHVEALEPTPFYFLVGCSESIGAGELEENIAIFYRRLFEGDSLTEAVKSIAKKLPAFLAEQMFTEAMIGYFKGQSRGRGKAARIERLVTRWVELHPHHTKEELRDFRAKLRRFLRPSVEEFYRNADLFLHGRYYINADDVLAFLETLPGRPQPPEDS